jgi:hypothetical protein
VSDRESEGLDNLLIYVNLANGNLVELEEPTGRELVQRLITETWEATPTRIVIQGVTEDGLKVRIGIPYEGSRKASVQIERA